MTQNWESSFFISWILQILLSEVLGVPSTLETGTRDAQLNYYHPDMPFDYGKSNIWDALKVSNEYNTGCPTISSAEDGEGEEGQDEEYVPCGHVMAETWPARLVDILPLESEGVIEPHHFLGVLGHQTWFIPRFTAENDPTLTSWYGMSGTANGNRKKLAERFKRPTTWSQYCEEISPNNCLGGEGTGSDIDIDDNTTITKAADTNSSVVVATRPPKDEIEGSKYYAEGEFTGYFRATDENNCDLYPNNCTGHYTDYPCDWAR